MRAHLDNFSANLRVFLYRNVYLDIDCLSRVEDGECRGRVDARWDPDGGGGGAEGGQLPRQRRRRHDAQIP